MDGGEGIISFVQGIEFVSIQDCLFVLFCVCLERILCIYNKGEFIISISYKDLL